MAIKSPIIPENITYNDLKYRLQNIQCCLPNKATTLLNRINLGINCCNEERELNIATAYLDILRCYITEWQFPYSYSYDQVIQLPTANYSITVNGYYLDPNSEVFTSFSVDNTGYFSSYPTPVSLNTIINDYITTTGLTMTISSYGSNKDFATFDLYMEFPCNYSDQEISGEFTYLVGLDTYSIYYNTTTSECITEGVTIDGPEYTNQDSANCLTREEVVNMFEWLQKYCCMCFPNYGNYDNVVTID